VREALPVLSELKDGKILANIKNNTIAPVAMIDPTLILALMMSENFKNSLPQ